MSQDLSLRSGPSYTSDNPSFGRPPPSGPRIHILLTWMVLTLSTRRCHSRDVREVGTRRSEKVFPPELEHVTRQGVLSRTSSIGPLSSPTPSVQVGDSFGLKISGAHRGLTYDSISVYIRKIKIVFLEGISVEGEIGIKRVSKRRVYTRTGVRVRILVGSVLEVWSELGL